MHGCLLPDGGEPETARENTHHCGLHGTDDPLLFVDRIAPRRRAWKAASRSRNFGCGYAWVATGRKRSEESRDQSKPCLINLIHNAPSWGGTVGSSYALEVFAEGSTIDSVGEADALWTPNGREGDEGGRVGVAAPIGIARRTGPEPCRCSQRRDQLCQYDENERERFMSRCLPSVEWQVR